MSKTVDEARIRLAYQAGCRLGENKLQEVSRKWEAMADLTDLRWSVIGHLQTNKAKLVARYAAEFQALDSLRVAEALDRRLQAEAARWMCMCRSIPRARPASTACSPTRPRPSCGRCRPIPACGCAAS